MTSQQCRDICEEQLAKFADGLTDKCVETTSEIVNNIHNYYFWGLIAIAFVGFIVGRFSQMKSTRFSVDDG